MSCLDPQANSMPNFKYPSTGGVLEGEGKEWGKSENFEVFSPAHIKIINPTGSGFLGKHAVPSSMHGILVAISGTSGLTKCSCGQQDSIVVNFEAICSGLRHSPSGYFVSNQ